VFLLKVSHELRTPLSAISLRAEALVRGMIADEARRAEHLRAIILRSVEDLDRLIEDVIDIARSDSGQLTMQRVSVPVVAPLDDALAALAPRAQAKGVTVVQHFERETAATVMVDGDPARLRQVFWNIAANAIKFTPAGGRISVDVSATAEAVDIAITGTGAGIAPDELALVFDEFHTRRTDNPSGLGLGLAIARQIVTQHGGSIRARSDGIGHGATFTVTLVRSGAGPGTAGPDA
jgi:signal transduction histidine kinase